MYLHQDREVFKDMVELVADNIGRAPAVVEKDYYVTQILRLLASRLDNCVFKGGTSLSKGFHVIDRFSEDIDISFNEHIGESRRKKLKNVVLKGISETLEMPITNWENTQSDKDYNAYLFAYESVLGLQDDRLPQYVKLEMALASYSFPTQIMEIENYIGVHLERKGRPELSKKYCLDKFSMNLQALERTYIDKVFALCDYYLQGKSKRYSRHLYDIYKLTPMLEFGEDFIKLVDEVRKHRSGLRICPSAQDNVDIPSVIMKFCDDDFYEQDYEAITSYFAADFVPYSEAIDQMRKLAQGNLFANRAAQDPHT